MSKRSASTQTDATKVQPPLKKASLSSIDFVLVDNVLAPSDISTSSKSSTDSKGCYNCLMCETEPYGELLQCPDCGMNYCENCCEEDGVCNACQTVRCMAPYACVKCNRGVYNEEEVSACGECILKEEEEEEEKVSSGPFRCPSSPCYSPTSPIYSPTSPDYEPFSQCEVESKSSSESKDSLEPTEWLACYNCAHYMSHKDNKGRGWDCFVCKKGGHCRNCVKLDIGDSRLPGCTFERMDTLLALTQEGKRLSGKCRMCLPCCEEKKANKAKARLTRV